MKEENKEINIRNSYFFQLFFFKKWEIKLCMFNELSDNISKIIVEADKLMNKKLIDDEAIKKLVDEIKAINF